MRRVAFEKKAGSSLQDHEFGLSWVVKLGYKPGKKEQRLLLVRDPAFGGRWSE